MKSQERYEIRNMNSGDLDALTIFFVRAYGPQTPFRSKRFLKWYFKFQRTGSWDGHASWIAVDTAGNVVSHYGCLSCDLMLGERPVPVMWGVNAYTLPEWRGLGINSCIVKKLKEDNEINGVIGFTRSTAQFYEQAGYNIFEFNRLKRHVKILNNEEACQASLYIGQKSDRFRRIFGSEQGHLNNRKYHDLVKLDEENIKDYEICFDYKRRVTTSRDKHYLSWRYLNNPFVRYGLYAFVNRKSILALMACRIERLNPLDHLVFRIVDVFGYDEGVRELLACAIAKARDRDCAYIDYSSAGNLFDELLARTGFVQLEDDDCDILPQVCSPISQRPNNEYFGLQSAKHSVVVKNLSIRDVHFTRADSDRDRLGNVAGPVSRWGSDE